MLHKLINANPHHSHVWDKAQKHAERPFTWIPNHEEKSANDKAKVDPGDDSQRVFFPDEGNHAKLSERGNDKLFETVLQDVGLFLNFVLLSRQRVHGPGRHPLKDDEENGTKNGKDAES